MSIGLFLLGAIIAMGLGAGYINNVRQKRKPKSNHVSLTDSVQDKLGLYPSVMKNHFGLIALFAVGAIALFILQDEVTVVLSAIGISWGTFIMLLIFGALLMAVSHYHKLGKTIPAAGLLVIAVLIGAAVGGRLFWYGDPGLTEEQASNSLLAANSEDDRVPSSKTKLAATNVLSNCSEQQFVDMAHTVPIRIRADCDLILMHDANFASANYMVLSASGVLLTFDEKEFVSTGRSAHPTKFTERLVPNSEAIIAEEEEIYLVTYELGDDPNWVITEAGRNLRKGTVL